MSYNRRKFLKRSAMFTAMIAASRSYTYETTTPPTRPLQFLVLGDSVSWGQGLNREEKFYALVQEWLKQQLQGRDVNVTVMAHSGATILPLEESAPGCDGEVNISWPTIHVQRLDAVTKYRREGIDPRMVDLVLINGGINDVGAGNLVNPFYSPEKIKSGADRFCYTAMKDLLLETGESTRVSVTTMN